MAQHNATPLQIHTLALQELMCLYCNAQISFLLPAAVCPCQHAAVLWLINLPLELTQGFSTDTGKLYLSPGYKAGLSLWRQGAGGKRKRTEVLYRYRTVLQYSPKRRVLVSKARYHWSWRHRGKVYWWAYHSFWKEGCLLSLLFPADYPKWCPNLPWAHLLLSDYSDSVVCNICFLLCLVVHSTDIPWKL